MESLNSEEKNMESLKLEVENKDTPSQFSFPKWTPASDWICSLVCS